MTTNFPSSIDSFPAPGPNLNSNPHSSMHVNEADAITALETKVGVNSSAVASTLDYLLKSSSSVNPGHTHTASAVSGLPPIVISDGSDGTATISSGTTTLTRDMYYQTLSVNGTGILATAGYKVFVKATCTVNGTSGAAIQNKGGNGANASGATGGAGGAVAGTGSTTAASIGGGAGGNGGTAGNGVAGTAGTTTTFNLNAVAGAAGGNGGAGGGGGIPGGGGAGGVTTSAAGIALRDLVTASLPFLFTSATAVQRANVTPGSGGGGGGGGNNGPGGGGGGAGASGGHLYLACQTLVLTGTGCINVNGGTGGNGANNTGVGGGGGGGGAGGNGGIATVFYLTKTGTGTIIAAGGTAGTFGLGGQGGGGGDNGIAGSNGTAGIVIELTP